MLNSQNENEFLNAFKSSDVKNQLRILETLLHASKPEVKYRINSRIVDITKYDIIAEVPLEIAEKILSYLDLTSLLRCREVSSLWKFRVECFDKVWQPHLNAYCIDKDGFQLSEECHAKQKRMKKAGKCEDLTIIGEKLFTFPSPDGDDTETNIKYSDSCRMSASFVMGRKLINNLKRQAGFNCIIDHDSRGSNVVMTMNSKVLAYAREDRHIVVKYTDFPHKKICVFEAHQCADIKIYDDKLITGGFDRTICIWEWDTGKCIHRFEGSVKPVYSLDISGCILVSSDGKSVITWHLQTYRMIRKIGCFDESSVEELKVVQVDNSTLKDVYSDNLLIVRSSKAVKVFAITGDGLVSFLSELSFEREINNLQPFIQVNENVVACSSDHGVIVWNLVDFTVLKLIVRDPCHACLFSARTPVFTRVNNCRVILLYYSGSLLLQYFVHKNRFQLHADCGLENNMVELSWNFPSDEKWPWSHRKPGLASLVLNMDKGFTMGTKITLFVATQGRKIYCMLFDASDFNYTLQTSQCSDIVQQKVEQVFLEEVLH